MYILSMRRDSGYNLCYIRENFIQFKQNRLSLFCIVWFIVNVYRRSRQPWGAVLVWSTEAENWLREKAHMVRKRRHCRVWSRQMKSCGRVSTDISNWRQSHECVLALVMVSARSLSCVVEEWLAYPSRRLMKVKWYPQTGRAVCFAMDHRPWFFGPRKPESGGSCELSGLPYVLSWSFAYVSSIWLKQQEYGNNQ